MNSFISDNNFLVFERLNNANVSYVAWKDTYKVQKYSFGNGEIDVLVDEKDKNSFERIILENGYVPLKTRKLLDITGIKHFIKYQNGKFYHLHVYYKLYTGNHYVKEYAFKPSPSLFKRATLVNNIKVVSPKDELAILILRLVAKKTLFLTSIKKLEIERAKELLKHIKVGSIDFSVLGCSNFSITDSEFLSLLNDGNVHRRSRKHLSFNRRYGHVVFRLIYFIRRIFLLFLRYKHYSNKTLPVSGVSIGILGSDGSGKSTISRDIFRLVGAKTSAKLIYLGGNHKTYSFKTWIYYAFYNFSRIFSPLKNKFDTAWFLYYLGISFLEYGKAVDRVTLIKEGARFREKGFVVIYERYPIIGLYDFPNSLFDAIEKRSFRHDKTSFKIVNYVASKIKIMYENISGPDLLFLLTVDFEIIKKRRNLTLGEIDDIKRKIETETVYFSRSVSKIIRINNNGEFNIAYNNIINLVNEKLCIYNL